VTAVTLSTYETNASNFGNLAFERMCFLIIWDWIPRREYFEAVYLKSSGPIRFGTCVCALIDKKYLLQHSPFNQQLLDRIRCASVGIYVYQFAPVCHSWSSVSTWHNMPWHFNYIMSLVFLIFTYS
jgi:hypothetical protein